MVGGAKSHLESNPLPARDAQGIKQSLCAPGPRDPTETEPDRCFSLSCEGPGLQWLAARAGALVQQTWVWHRPS